MIDSLKDFLDLDDITKEKATYVARTHELGRVLIEAVQEYCDEHFPDGGLDVNWVLGAMLFLASSTANYCDLSLEELQDKLKRHHKLLQKNT